MPWSSTPSGSGGLPTASLAASFGGRVGAGAASPPSERCTRTRRPLQFEGGNTGQRQAGTAANFRESAPSRRPADIRGASFIPRRAQGVHPTPLLQWDTGCDRSGTTWARRREFAGSTWGARGRCQLRQTAPDRADLLPTEPAHLHVLALTLVSWSRRPRSHNCAQRS